MKEIIGGIIAFVFLLSMHEVVMPVIVGANTTGWSLPAVAMWGLLPLALVASAAFFVIRQ